ncbi:hypothetical protein [Halanaeroarchaeum sulfurireducens]|uniref:Uncharacterized protein n=1 Tax=Halanaeroarchaeum sulfurireducens TaxID=1604004 RepID=A0A0F7P7X6_9EURY|nr:hypothetical protein [Halanaeroarchaeum sulfurireducens]AKH96817.1 hypothetical protein HLASF_0310 [Halanaeroarchaeum sulfurireducens]ALG81219.1 hypothetical protein HLASA_0309 [Halanaeroarchaeum sulfurireducens]
MTARGTRTMLVALVAALAAIALTIGGVGPAVAADDSPPAVPSSYFGTVHDEGGGAPADGTTIVAVGYDGDGAVVDRDSITVQDGRYGGSGGFDDKLRIASDAANVTFYVGSTNGTQLEPTDDDPSSGVHEWDLTASGGAFGGEVSTTAPSSGPTATMTSTQANEVLTIAPKQTGVPTTTPAEETVTEEPTQNQETPTEATETTESSALEPVTTDASDDEGFGLPLSMRSLAGLLLLVGVVLYSRSGNATAVSRLVTLPAALTGLLGTESSEEGGQIRATNAVEQEIACKVRCKTPSETVFLETIELEAGATSSLGDVPDEKFQLAVSISDGPTATETVEPGEEVSDVEIRIDTEGVHIE